MPLDPEPVRPHGRSEVVTALLEAATRLFAERGPAAVSLRDVAHEANVNLGLIHRYIGSKDDLLAAVLSARPGYPPPDANSLRTPEAIVDTVLDLVSTDADYARIMLRTALDGYNLARLQNTFPVLERAARAARSDLPRRDADMRIAMLAATALSWQSIGGELLGILKQRDVAHDEVVAALRPALIAFLTADSST